MTRHLLAFLIDKGNRFVIENNLNSIFAVSKKEMRNPSAVFRPEDSNKFTLIRNNRGIKNPCKSRLNVARKDWILRITPHGIVAAFRRLFPWQIRNDFFIFYHI